MATAPRKQVSRGLAWLALAWLAQAGLGERPAAAQPPSLGFLHAAAVAAYATSISRTARAIANEPTRSAATEPKQTEPRNEAPRAEMAEAPQEPSADTRTPRPEPAGSSASATHHDQARAGRALLAPSRPPPLPSVLERLGGDHARRAMQVAQGVPTGRVALRPMFWMTRDRRGGMVALGGRF